jgi:predicted dehydrogenase
MQDGVRLLPIASRKEIPPMTLLKWGLLSTARINRRLMPAIRAVDRAELVAVASRSHDRAEAYAREWDIPRAHGSYEALLDDPGIDAVYISLPNSLHAEWTVRAARAGKHVLCEKPLCLGVAECDEIVAAAESAGVVVAEALMYLYHPLLHRAQQLVKEGALGQITLVRGAYTFFLDRLNDVRWRPELGGGALWDVGSYPVSFIRWIAGEPEEVFGWQTLSASGVDMTFAGLLRYENGILGLFDSGFRQQFRVHAEVTGTEGTLVLVGVAGVLRSLVFPFHPRSVHSPGSAAVLILPVSAGGYLLVRVQALIPVLSEQRWIMVLAAVALLAGGLLAWTWAAGTKARRGDRPIVGQFWAGALVQQTAYTLAFGLLVVGVVPWPLVNLVLALAALTIWWDSLQEPVAGSRSEWIERSQRRIGSWLAATKSYITVRLPILGRWRDSWLDRQGIALLPGIALASLAGVPFTTGARGRWSYYAAWLQRGDASLLVAMAADVLLMAGLWLALGATVEQARTQRLRPSALLAILALVITVVILGIAPGAFGSDTGLREAGRPGVSVWGLGLLYALPWLLGVWLARLKRPQESHLDRVSEVVALDWLYGAASWVGRRLEGALHWLGNVGEGEGWWGWALIVLALGVILLIAR